MRIKAVGSSMMPAIPSGSILDLEIVDIDAIEPGDVVCYPVSSSEVVAHRVIGFKSGPKDSSRIILRGDSQSEEDEVARESVQYRVLGVCWRGISYSCDSWFGKGVRYMVLRNPAATQNAARVVSVLNRIAHILKKRVSG